MRRFTLIVALLVIASGTVIMAYSSADAWARNTRVHKQRQQYRTLAAQVFDQRVPRGANAAAIP